MFMNNLIIKNLKTRLAVNLDFVKELEVPAKLIDRTSEVINNNDGTINAGSTLTYMITKNDFSEAINKLGIEEVYKKLSLSFKEKALNLLNNKAIIVGKYENQMFEEYKRYIINNLDQAAKRNLWISTERGLFKDYLDSIAGSMAHVDNSVNENDLVISYKIAENIEEALKITAYVWLYDLKPTDKLEYYTKG